MRFRAPPAARVGPGTARLGLEGPQRRRQHPVCLFVLFHADRDPGHDEGRRGARARQTDEEGRQHRAGDHGELLPGRGAFG